MEELGINLSSEYSAAEILLQAKPYVYSAVGVPATERKIPRAYKDTLTLTVLCTYWVTRKEKVRNNRFLRTLKVAYIERKVRE